MASPRKRKIRPQPALPQAAMSQPPVSQPPVPQAPPRSRAGWLWGLTTVAAGVAAAWPFRHSPTESSRTNGAGQPPLVASNFAVPLSMTTGPSHGFKIPLDPDSDRGRTPPRVGASLRRDSQAADTTDRIPASPEPSAPLAPPDVSTESLGSPPPLPEAFPQESRPTPAPPSESPAVSAVATPEPELRQHRVRDGDSLARLAERYLGDATRAAELFALNRDQLSEPDVLPIGVRLKIPATDGRRTSGTSPD